MFQERLNKLTNKVADVIASPGKLKLEPSPPSGETVSKEFEEILQKIKTSGTHCYFVSPHLDDAVLSAGNLIKHLSGITEVTVISVMTGYSETKSKALNWMEKCGYYDPNVYMQERQEEDIAALKQIGAKHIHLGFPDMNPESAMEEPLIVSSLLEEIAKSSNSQDHQIFGPSAVGRQHKDHHLVNKIIRDVFAYPILWQESSLSTVPKDKPLRQLPNPSASIWDHNTLAKIDAIYAYASQVESLFPKRRVVLPQERYFFSIDILKESHNLSSVVSGSAQRLGQDLNE